MFEAQLDVVPQDPRKAQGLGRVALKFRRLIIAAMFVAHSLAGFTLRSMVLKGI